MFLIAMLLLTILLSRAGKEVLHPPPAGEREIPHHVMRDRESLLNRHWRPSNPIFAHAKNRGVVSDDLTIVRGSYAMLENLIL
jgi:hypothetical protein